MGIPHADTQMEQRPALGALAGSAVDAALALAEGSPIKDREWMERAARMCPHCREREDVYAAAARILAEQARWYKAEYEAWRMAYASKPNDKLTDAAVSDSRKQK